MALKGSRIERTAEEMDGVQATKAECWISNRQEERGG